MIKNKFALLGVLVFVLTFTISVLYTVPMAALAQFEGPDRKKLFVEDRKEHKKAEKLAVDAAFTEDAVDKSTLDFQAPQIQFNQDTNEMLGSGGVLITGRGIQVQSKSAIANTDTQDVQLNGDVLLSSGGMSVSASRGTFNMETEAGTFYDTTITYENGGYEGNASQIDKLSDTEYELKECTFSTCHCEDKSQPWSIKANSAEVEQEGYGFVHGATVNMWDVPILYTPWLAFPAKMERQSGLLVPTLGISNKDGFIYEQPLFLVLNDSADMTVRPFMATETRYGVSLDYRQSFSTHNNVNSRFYYSDERTRGDSLRGVVTEGMYDPTFDKDRYAGFYKHNWSTESGAAIPSNFIADVRIVGDNLFVREIEDPEIAERQDRYVTSSMLLRSTPLDFLSTEVSGEYNQSLYTNQDYVLQRLPQFSINEMKSFRPFGYNPYGVKLVTKTDVTITNFNRDEGYDGWRFLVVPQLTVPFYYKNYVDSSASITFNYADYALDDKHIPGTTDQLVREDDRYVPIFNYNLGTGVESVYDVSSGGFWDTMAGLGADNKHEQLSRIKHTIEPAFRYLYIPKTSDTDLPSFDSSDRIHEKNLYMFGFKSSFYGRFKPRRGAVDDITELTPYVDELPIPELDRPLGDYGVANDLLPFTSPVNVRRGEIRELVTLNVWQGYDTKIDDSNPAVSKWTDLRADLDLFFNKYFMTRWESNIDTQDSGFSSWGLSTYFRDDRNDLLRLRYTYQEDSISQLEGNLEIVLLERLKAGFYTRYDNEENEFIENRAALRIASACDCWYFDVGVSDKINPDKTAVIFRLTFAGLGDITAGAGVADRSLRE